MKTIISVVMLMLMTSLSYANDIYVTQSGANLDLDITQDGSNTQLVVQVHHQLQLVLQLY